VASAFVAQFRLCVSLLHNLGVLDLVTAGEAFDDFVFFDLTSLPQPGHELKTNAFVRTVGGGAVITAVAAARLGLRCAVVSGLSVDAVRLLRRERVSIRNVRRRGEPAALTVALSTRRDRRYVTFNGINERLPRRIRGIVPGLRARHLHFAFYPRPCRPWIAVVEAIRSRGGSTSWDFGWNPGLARDPHLHPLAAAVDYLFLNRDEALLYARQTRLPAAIDRWRRCPRTVVIKLGADGSRLVGGGVDLHAPARRARVIDTTGAGDAFNAGFLVAALRGDRLPRALAFANRVGALSTRHAGGIDGLPRAL
jgi:sugar/nucleoside kinase (ribokinase family)